MKILYVEDELAKNIPRIIRLFASYLGKERSAQLEALETSEYGANPEEIKKIVEETQLIDIECRFPDALKKVVHDYQKYRLLIIDRNLLENGYTLEEVREIVPEYDENHDKQYSGREGDYLLLRLGNCSCNLINNTYFLTAYSAQDELRSHRELNLRLDLKRFKEENFIEKDSARGLERLRDTIYRTLPGYSTSK